MTKVEVKVNKNERDTDHPITLRYGEYSILLNRNFCKQTLKDALLVLGTIKC